MERVSDSKLVCRAEKFADQIELFDGDVHVVEVPDDRVDACDQLGRGACANLRIFGVP